MNSEPIVCKGRVASMASSLRISPITSSHNNDQPLRSRVRINPTASRNDDDDDDENTNSSGVGYTNNAGAQNSEYDARNADFDTRNANDERHRKTPDIDKSTRNLKPKPMGIPTISREHFGDPTSSKNHRNAPKQRPGIPTHDVRNAQVVASHARNHAKEFEEAFGDLGPSLVVKNPDDQSLSLKFQRQRLSSYDLPSVFEASDFIGLEIPEDMMKKERHYQPRVRVDVCVIFLKVGEIDTLKEQYEADVMVKTKWKEPALNKENNVQFPIDWSKYWNPKLFIENTIGDPKESAFQMLTYNDKGEAIVIEKRRVKGTFLENLELNDFPFDVQDLTVTVMCERHASEVELMEDPDELHRVNKQSFIDEQEWHLYKCIETELKEVTTEYSDPSVRKSAMYVRCRAARRPLYFLWNIFLITFLICSLVFATFSVDRSLPQNRLQLSFTLVLTSVAFKFVVNQSLPKISYLTYLDKYVLAAMILLTSVCAWHGVTTITGTTHGQLVDFIALITFAVLYLSFNAVFALRIWMKPGRKRQRMQRKEKEYIEKIQDQINRRSMELRKKLNSSNLSSNVSII